MPVSRGARKADKAGANRDTAINENPAFLVASPCQFQLKSTLSRLRHSCGRQVSSLNPGTPRSLHPALSWNWLVPAVQRQPLGGC